MSIIMGPVLSLRGSSEDKWHVSVLIVSDGSEIPELKWGISDHPATGKVLKSLQGRNAIAYQIMADRADTDQSVAYTVGDKSGDFHVPGKSQPLNITYASCNGFSDPKLMRDTGRPQANWETMNTRHETNPIHVLAMGGDQIYCDPVWNLNSLEDWQDMRGDAKWEEVFSPAMQQEVESFYFDLYLNRWTRPGPASMFARVPTLMMWDDHDIFDGWGSHSNQRQNSPVFKGIYKIAREHYLVFQQHIKPNATPPGNAHPAQLANAGPDNLSLAHRIDDVGLLALDLRSERSRWQVMSDTTYNGIKTWMDNLDEAEINHLVVLSSIPVAHPEFSAIEQFLDTLWGTQELEDDLGDHWSSYRHADERRKLVHRLLDFSRDKKCRVTILSGDVHIGALSVIESTRRPVVTANENVITQLTSSGIVHPAPPAVLRYHMDHIADKEYEIDRGITGRQAKYTGTDKHYIYDRNWLSLTIEPQGRIFASLQVEGSEADASFNKVIHPVG